MTTDVIDTVASNAPTTPGTLRDTRGNLLRDAVLGFRKYWYPAMRSSELTGKPKALKMLGDNLVFVRANGRPHALHDRCAHRGMVLSEGVCLAEGTITCPYHGWTYDVANGELVAALTDGPDSAVVGKKGKLVPTYPVEERKGMIWVFMGDGTPPPLEADVPVELLDPEYLEGLITNDWKCNWRAAVENGHDAAHAPMVHMNSFRWRASFNRPFAWYGHVENTLKDQYLYRRPKEMGYGGVYPRVGEWPKFSWLRRTIQYRTSAGGGGRITNSFRLPSMIRNSYPDYSMVRWVVPIDESHCRNFMFLTGRSGSTSDRLTWLTKYWLWHRWVFCTWFTKQDEKIVEKLDWSAPEVLFRPDSSIVGLRKYIEENVRPNRRSTPFYFDAELSKESR